MADGSACAADRLGRRRRPDGPAGRAGRGRRTCCRTSTPARRSATRRATRHRQRLPRVLGHRRGARGAAPTSSITGRVTDAAVVMRPGGVRSTAGHRTTGTRWPARVVAGHVIECGAQATGGNYSFFTEVPGMRHAGFPVAEIAADGSLASSRKHPGTGGQVVDRHGHLAAALRDRRPALPQPRRRRPLRHHPAASDDGTRPGAHRRACVASRPPATLKVAINYARRLPQRLHVLPHRPRHRGQGGAARGADLGPCPAAATRSHRPARSSCAPTTTTRRPTRRRPPCCGSPSRIPTSARSGGRSPTSPIEIVLASHPRLLRPRRRPGAATPYGVFWPARCRPTSVPQYVHRRRHG